MDVVIFILTTLVLGVLMSIPGVMVGREILSNVVDGNLLGGVYGWGTGE